MLLKAAELLAAAGELPVNVRFACDGEEEIGGHSIVEWVAAGRARRGRRRRLRRRHGRRATCPAFSIAVRGLCYFHVTVRTGERDLHSGIVRRGGAERDARAHADARGRAPARRAPARAAARRDRAAAPEEIAAWSSLPAGRERARGRRRAAGRRRGGRGVLPAHVGRAVGRRARDRAAARPILAEDGDPGRGRGERLDPPRRRPGSGRDRAARSSGCCARRLPAGAEVEITLCSSAPPGLVARGCARRAARARRVRARARRAAAARPLRRRDPARRGARRARASPTILTGFALNESNIHSPNERIPAALPAARRRDDVRALPPPRRSLARRRLTRRPLAEELADGRARAVPALRPHRHAGATRTRRRTRAPRSSSTSRGCSSRSCARSGSTTSS